MNFNKKEILTPKRSMRSYYITTTNTGTSSHMDMKKNPMKFKVPIMVYALHYQKQRKKLLQEKEQKQREATNYRIRTTFFRFKKENNQTIRNIFLSSMYYSDGDFDETLEQLQNTINKYPKDAISIIGGEFNTHYYT